MRADDRSVAAFIMSLLGFLVFPPLGIWGYIWAKQTERAYSDGSLPAANQGLVTAAKILGIICIVILALLAALIVILIAAAVLSS